MRPEKDAESAYGSDTSSKSEFTLKIDDREKNQNWKPWYKKPKIWIQVVLLAAFFIILVLILRNTNTLVNDSSKVIQQNERNFAMMTQLETRIKKVESHLKNDDMVFNKTYETAETKINPDKPIIKSEEQQIEKSTTTSPTTVVNQIPKITQNPPKLVDMKTSYYNAASFRFGAKVDIGRSSSNVNSSAFSFDQSSYAILEREPVPSKAWCTNSEKPYITISLSKGVRPIAFSYQHLRWNGSIPDGAPMEYDVVACFEKKYETVEIPLALNCKYESSGPQEQRCLVPLSTDYYSKAYSIRFYFRKNHGNSKTTCAYLIRVFAEGHNPIEPTKPSKETCSSLIWHRKNSPFFYNYILEKNCKVWYNNDCCADCPECCTECVPKDMNYKSLLGIAIVILICIAVLLLGVCAAEAEERKRLRYQT